MRLHRHRDGAGTLTRQQLRQQVFTQADVVRVHQQFDRQPLRPIHPGGGGVAHEQAESRFADGSWTSSDATQGNRYAQPQQAVTAQVLQGVRADGGR